ncbi:hypothetical protein HNP86_001992 [Methanococcus maripaludis]|uniref:Uncharacterized protein n=1 Tax=Methanococcus maripaludis TaxID=39152 RepID=A0A7J9NXT3_METMI|nr:hypothetical protein [Methanococcus maripaludis]MBA2851833.1 hypothetical protein [Methanococcus maripaludis]
MYSTTVKEMEAMVYREIEVTMEAYEFTLDSTTIVNSLYNLLNSLDSMDVNAALQRLNMIVSKRSTLLG